jgi:putative peptidoglycan lipid II flippase
MNPGLYRKVGIASLIMAASIFSSRLIGLLREVVIAYAAGAGGDVDAYQVSFILPDILNHIAASGFLSVTFIPIFSVYVAGRREEEGWRVLSVVFTCFGSLLAAGILIGGIFAPQLVSVLAPGLTDPSAKGLAVRMTRIILPAQFFFFAGGLFMAVQFAKEKFVLPAMAPLF